MPPDREIRYDAFISYSPADEQWVFDWLLPRLKAAGLEIAIDQESFQPGAPVVEETERAITQSRYTVVVLSSAWVADQWGHFEALLVQHQDPAARLRRLIPILIEPCNPPERIKLLHWVDLTQMAQREAQLQRVIQAIGGQHTLPELRPEQALPSPERRWWELRWFALTGAAALLTLALLGGWIWSQRGPTQMDRVFNVAVAEIGEITPSGSMVHSDLGERLSAWIFNGLQDQNAQYEDRSSVLIWHDSLPWGKKGRTLGRIEGETAEARATAANTLAQAINAHVIIYGYLSGQDPQQVTIEFYVPRRLGNESNLTVGRYQFGDPIPVPANFDPGDTLSAGALEERVTVRANALYWLLLGVRQDLLGRYNEALAIFQRAQQELPRWREEGEGKENLYYFIGREHLFLQQYDDAEVYLQEALDRRPDFARAQIALGGVHFRRAQEPLQQDPPQPPSQPELTEALAGYEKGVELAQRANDPLLADIARMALASAIRLQAKADQWRGQFSDAVDTHDRAIALLEPVIERLADAEQYRLLGQAYQYMGVSQWERGEALGRLGSVAEARASYNQAVTAFDACIAQEANLPEDEFFEADVAAACRDWKAAVQATLAENGD